VKGSNVRDEFLAQGTPLGGEGQYGGEGCISHTSGTRIRRVLCGIGASGSPSIQKCPQTH